MNLPDEDHVLVVDDEPGVRRLLKAMLELRGHGVALAEDGEQALRSIERSRPSLVITDLRMPGLSGQKLLQRLKAAQPLLPVVVISAFGGPRDIVEVIKNGAEDYLSKPFVQEDLDLVVLKALEKRRLLLENERLRAELGRKPQGNSGFVGASAVMQRTLQTLGRLAQSGGQVLVTGESGTGKELAARALHALSTRRTGPFVDVNAGAIPSTLFEAELFGAKKGSYTGADADRPGLFAAAHGGTLFLDEVGEIPLEAQSKLLRVLETGELRALGEPRARKVDVRVVAATNRDLQAMVRDGAFRRDLYYRLGVLLLHLPPLREHREDIPALVAHFFASLPGRPQPQLTPDALRALMRHAWPGNVRELRNVLERATAFAGGGAISAEDLLLDAGTEEPAPGTDFRQAKQANARAFELRYLGGLLRNNKGNVSKAAAEAGMDRRNFHTLLRRHQLDPKNFKSR